MFKLFSEFVNEFIKLYIGSVLKIIKNPLRKFIQDQQQKFPLKLIMAGKFIPFLVLLGPFLASYEIFYKYYHVL